MLRLAVVLLVLAVPCAITACQRNPPASGPGAMTATPDSGPANAEQAPAVSAAPRATVRPSLPSAPPLPEGTRVSYACKDGSELTVTYTHASAELRWSDGRDATLSRAAASPEAGAELYAAGTLSLHRDGAGAWLRDGGATTACTESAATA
jgi:hypothetical protein